MKKLIISSLIILGVVFLANKLSAQNPIPSFHVPIIVDPTIFEEVIPSFNTQFSYLASTLKQPRSIDERRLKVMVQSPPSRQLAWAVVIVYSLDQQSTYGPFTVLEGEVHESIIDERQWGVRVMDSSSDCLLSVWIE